MSDLSWNATKRLVYERARGCCEYCQGLTPVGRATIARLKINQERIVIARERWIIGKFHPPNS